MRAFIFQVVGKYLWNAFCNWISQYFSNRILNKIFNCFSSKDLRCFVAKYSLNHKFTSLKYSRTKTSSSQIKSNMCAHIKHFRNGFCNFFLSFNNFFAYFHSIHVKISYAYILNLLKPVLRVFPPHFLSPPQLFILNVSLYV